jgi:hypothetical protein
VTVAIPAGLSPERQRICEVALAEIGTGEVPFASNRGPCERYMPAWQINALRQRDREEGRTVLGPPWCAFFVCWVWHQALGQHPLGAHVGGVAAMRGRAMERHLYLPMDPDADLIVGPAPGDAFVMLADDGRSGHTGIILRVSPDGREWVTCEGNTGHRVRVGRRKVGATRMRGVISVMADMGHGLWELGLGDVEGVEDVTALGTR